jgi:hypothetical protein
MSLFEKTQHVSNDLKSVASAHTKIGLENEDTRKLRNEVTLFSTIITVPRHSRSQIRRGANQKPRRKRESGVVRREQGTQGTSREGQI